MTDEREDTEPRSGLNPALKQRRETTHDTSRPSPAPADTASVQREEGRAWPIIWVVVTVLCVAITVYLLI